MAHLLGRSSRCGTTRASFLRCHSILFELNMNHFAKTGSGQTQEKLRQKGAFRFLQGNTRTRRLRSTTVPTVWMSSGLREIRWRRRSSLPTARGTASRSRSRSITPRWSRWRDPAALTTLTCALPPLPPSLPSLTPLTPSLPHSLPPSLRLSGSPALWLEQLLS